jgi:hypothetical protein
MSFGPTNWPATFITFIHDVNSIWKELANQNSLPINNNMNTRIIVNDIVSWAESPACALAYMQCQLKVCKAYNLSLNLRKSHFPPPLLQICCH